MNRQKIGRIKRIIITTFASKPDLSFFNTFQRTTNTKLSSILATTTTSPLPLLSSPSPTKNEKKETILNEKTDNNVPLVSSTLSSVNSQTVSSTFSSNSPSSSSPSSFASSGHTVTRFKAKEGQDKKKKKSKQSKMKLILFAKKAEEVENANPSAFSNCHSQLKLTKYLVY